MAGSSTFYPLAAVFNQLSSTLSTQLSGTFLIATEHNTSCRFAIERGVITHCTHSREKGAAAVLSLLQIKHASCSFSEHLMLPFRAEAAVEHAFCLQILGLKLPVETDSIVIEETIEPAAPTHPHTSTTNRSNRFYRGGYALGDQ